MPRSPQDNELIRVARREEIFLAAARVFAKKGFAATKIADIAGEAGLSHGLLYHYYRSKEQVYGALFVEIVGRMAGLERELVGITRAIDRIERRIALWLARGDERPELTVLITQALVGGLLPKNVRGSFLAHARGTHDALVRDLRAAQRAGDATRAVSAEELAAAILALLRGLSTLRFVQASAFDRSDQDAPNLGQVSVATVLRVVEARPNESIARKTKRARAPKPRPRGALRERARAA